MNEDITYEQRLRSIVARWEGEIVRISKRLIELSENHENEIFEKEADRLKKEFQNVGDALKLANSTLDDFLNSK